MSTNTSPTRRIRHEKGFDTSQNSLHSGTSQVASHPSPPSALSGALRNTTLQPTRHDERARDLSSLSGPEQIVLTYWPGDGQEPGSVCITGSFNSWQHNLPLHAPADDKSPWTTALSLPPGTHRFKFIVDDEWKCCTRTATTQDEDGNLVNIVEIPKPSGAAGASNQSGSPLDRSMMIPVHELTHGLLNSAPADQFVVGSYGERKSRTALGTMMGTSLPASITDNRPMRLSAWDNRRNDSPPGEYSRTSLNADQLAALAQSAANSGSLGAGSISVTAAAAGAPTPIGAFTLPPPTLHNDDSSTQPMLVIDPPILPAQLTRVLLNFTPQDQESLVVPTHVVLNHLYACSISDRVMSVAITTRYRRKHVSTVLYRMYTG